MADKNYKLRFGMSDGSTKEAAFSVPVFAARPQDYGAKGDGTTDDTAAFQSALAANRVVHVPGGTYKLSGELTIGNNCCLELSQDTVLNFTQTSGNCISMTASSSIIANHGLVKVPYAFTGKAINIDAGLDPDLIGIQPFTKWGPMWNAARYITDLHIVKLNSNGIARSLDGKCSGTAVYLRASKDDALNFLWAVDLSRLRIAGAFTYGIHLDCTLSGMTGWIHQTRISAFVSAAEIGVYCKDSTLSYLDVMVLPYWADDNSVYAKHGIKIENSTNVDLSGSRVMDWDARHSRWAEGSEYQHLALIGNCSGAILNEHYYYDSSNYDIRSLIYTDTPSNLERLTILQEPFTRWFKPIDNEPYFYDGSYNKKLVLKDELDEIANVERIPTFTDKLSTAIDTDGSVFNGIGYYAYGHRINASNGLVIDDPYYGCTGFIPAKKGDTIYADYLKVNGSDNYVNAVLYNSSFGRVMSINAGNLVTNAQHYSLEGYEETETGFKVRLASKDATNDKVAYIRFTFTRAGFGSKPVISVNEPIGYTQSGFLADSVKVKAENIIGLGSGGGSGSGEDESTPGLSPGSAQPDLNAAPGEPGHILNRTHWAEIAEVELLPETTGMPQNFSGYDGFAIPGALSSLLPDKTYKVKYNGVEYTVTSFEMPASWDNMVAMGNTVAIGGANTGEPFAMVQLPAEYQAMGVCVFVIPLDGATSVTVSISGEGEIVHELDGKFLPTGLPYSEIVEVRLLPPTTGEPAQEMGFDGFAIAGTMPAIVPGVAYDVVYNGVKYTSTAFQLPPAMNNLMAMGNTIAIGGANTGEPFAFVQYPEVYQQNFGKCAFVLPIDGAASVTVSVFGKSEKIHKLDSKYLHDSVPRAIPKPYSYTAHIAGDDEGLYLLNPGVELTEGNTYAVNYNGTGYTLKCKLGGAQGSRALYLGNGDWIVGESSDEPFGVYVFDPPLGGMMGSVLRVYEGSTDVDISITGENLEMRKLDKRLLPEDAYIPLVIDAEVDFNNNVTITSGHTYDDVYSIVDGLGGDVVIRCDVDNGHARLRLNYVSGGDFWFGGEFYPFYRYVLIWRNSSANEFEFHKLKYDKTAAD